MPIMKPAQANKVKASTKSTSLHFSNETTAPAQDDSGAEVENNMSVDTLIDPEDYESAGSTHFSNDEDSHPVLAKKIKRVKASADEAGGSTVDPTTTNVGTIPNDVDPATDVLTEAAFGDDDEDDPDAAPLNTEVEDDPDDVDFGGADVEVEADTHEGNGGAPAPSGAPAAEMQNNMSTEPLEVNAEADDEEDWDAPPKETDEDLVEDDVAELEDGDQDVAVEDLSTEVEPEAASTGADMSILDIDETPDGAVDDVAFAAAGTRLLCIKANRVIATMTGRMALATGRNNQYLTDQFQQVTAMELKAKGLRRGLKSMGFALATVSLAKQAVLQAQVAKEVTKTTAAVRKVAADKDRAFQQSLAIAAVGINRKMFKDTENTLRAHLEGEFRRYGFTGAGKILAHAFAEHGPAYAKQVIELATKISAMPEEVRDGYVDMMDLQTGVGDEPDEDMVPIGADDDVEEDEFDNSNFGETIEATLARPGTRIKASAVTSAKYSVTANQILNGDLPMFHL